MIIQAFNIDMSNKSRNSVSRGYEVVGEPEAVFHIIVQNASGHYYNFPENTIINQEAGVFAPTAAFSTTPSNLFNQKIPSSGVYNGAITFPVDHTDTHYIITVIAGNETTFDLNVFNNKKIFISEKINAYKITGVTFSITHSNAAVVEPSGNNAPIVFKGKSSQVDRSNVNNVTKINWPFTLSSSSASIIRQPIVDDFEFTTTKLTRNIRTTTGATTSVELMDVTGLSVGMDVKDAEDQSLGQITKIILGFKDFQNSTDGNQIYKIPVKINDDGDGVVNSTAGTIVISTAFNWGVSGQLTFTGKGSSASNIFNKTRFKIKNFKIEIDPVVTTTDVAVSNSTTIPITSTNGIKAADTVLMSGIGVTTTAPHVDTVNSGVSVVVSSAQTIENGQTVTFTGSSRSGKITGELEVLEYGDSNITLDFNFNNILNVS
ncbi:MAG: hypothetical protein CMC94_05405 [Flavobacteriales bacterium]|nr:hypothetical protein [Flavobacteriales bacterium]